MHLKKSILLLLLCSSIYSHAAFVQHDGKWSDSRYIPTLTLTEHYDVGYRNFQDNQWYEALRNFLTILIHFPDSPFQADAIFYSGVCYYFLEEYDLANVQFDRYIRMGTTPKHFESAFEFKFHIAERFANKGTMKHPMGLQIFPKIAFATKGDALKIYDEVIAALPSHELAIKALFGKGNLHMKQGEDKESIDVFQTLARRFPKHTLAADSYLLISEIYLNQSEMEAQDPDVCSLAQINLRKFQSHFPGDERIAQSEENLHIMKGYFAASLFKTGRYYERKKKPKASVIYYREAVNRFPKTEHAQKSEERLKVLEKALAKA
ncbi:MAG: Outer membrane protein assembly factor BamD [Chlamydiae bacterium]|nr:Outer membrane protein assembly factor BamD [Chlamydiota bacterium]